MVRAIKVLVALAVLYFLVAEGIPYIRNRVEGISEDKILGSPRRLAGPAGECVRLMDDADRFISRELIKFDPPYDLEEWTASYGEIDGVLAVTRVACQCDDPACDAGQEAVAEMEGLVLWVDSMLQEGRDLAGRISNRQERVEEKMQRAHVLIDG